MINPDKLTVKSGEALNDAIAALTAVGVTSLECRPPTLEELFLRHYGSAV